MRNSIQVVAALAVALLGICMWIVAEAQPRPVSAAPAVRPFDAYQSGGNCIYIVTGKYASFISVVLVGPGGC